MLFSEAFHMGDLSAAQGHPPSNSTFKISGDSADFTVGHIGKNTDLFQSEPTIGKHIDFTPPVLLILDIEQNFITYLVVVVG